MSHKIFKTIICFSCLLVSSCIGALWTGADLLYDRNSYSSKFNDYELNNLVHQTLMDYQILNQADNLIDYTVFNGDILVAGHVTTKNLKERTQLAIKNITGYRNFYNMLTVGKIANTEFTDSMITAHIRAEIFKDQDVLPKTVKIVTVDCNVYLLGDMPADHSKIIEDLARGTPKVDKVFNLIHGYITVPQKLH
jgi:osmotically-inducible protein OsmY